MKKIEKITAACVSALLLLSLVACGETSDETVYDNFVSEHVETAEAWSAAFDFDGIANAAYSMNYESKGRDFNMNVGYVDVSLSYENLYEYDGDKIHFRTYAHSISDTEERIDPLENYIEKNDDNITIYYFDQENEQWVNETVTSQTVLSYYCVNSLSEFMTRSGMFFDTSIDDGSIDDGVDVRQIGLERSLRNRFSKFTYDNKIGAYVYGYQADADDYFNFTVKIKDGKFFGMNVDFRYNEFTGSLCSRLYDIGATVVTIPTV